jgi:8-oxo-dGTP pyrophosphatase MutT (NUDIX family)
VKESIEARFPHLMAPLDNRGATGRFVVSNELPDENLIGNAYLVPRVGQEFLYLVEEGGRLQLPGGKKEPGERHAEALSRELLDEAGVELVAHPTLVGHWRIQSKLAEPLRPHLPHPDSAGVVFSGQVRQVAAPSNPSGAGATREVAIAPLTDVLGAFRSNGRDDLADLYALAYELAP